MTGVSGGGGAGGTVTSVSIITANGVSGSVATPTTTPAITLTLGAIVPTTVNGLAITATAGTLTIPNNAAASLATSGNFAITLTATANTNVTLPTSGTLVTSFGVPWTEVTGTSQAMAVNNGYIANNAALVTLTLPATAAVGDIFRIAGEGAGLWRCAQNAGQQIHFGNQNTTLGAGGYLGAVHQYDCVELICITANTDFVVMSSIGNITVV